MVPSQQLHPVLLDEAALQHALMQKGSLRGGDGADLHPVSPLPLRRRKLKRPLGSSSLILLDEEKLQQALQAKAERRKALNESQQRRQTARSSMDRFLDGSSINNPTPAKPTSKSCFKKVDEDNVATNMRKSKTVRVMPSADAPATAGVVTGVATKKETRVVKKKKMIVRKDAESQDSNEIDSSNEKTEPKSLRRKIIPAKEARLHGDPIETRPESAPTPQVSSRKRCQQPGSNKPITRSAQKKNLSKVEDGRHDDGQRLRKVVVRRVVKRPKQESIAPTGNKEKRCEQSLPPRANNLGKGEERETRGITAQPDEWLPTAAAPPTHTSSVAPKPMIHQRDPGPPFCPDTKALKTSSHSNLVISKGSEHSYIDPSSFHSQVPPSWSHRNKNRTGFTPNELISQETMTAYTEALGGVETVEATTKMFYEKAKRDPELKVLFKKNIRWEHMRNEFIILANLQVQTRFDENIKPVLEHHCRLLENGADMDRLTSLWDAAIESSWMENEMNDAMKLLAAPSRVIFNLRALERHYAMYLKDQRTDSRRSSKKDDTGDVQGRRDRRGLFGRFRRN